MAIVIQKQPSFLENLLFGLGAGVEKGVDQFYKERDRKRGMTSQLLSKVLSGEISPELLATDLGQSFQRELGIAKEPALKQATQMGLEEVGYSERTEYLPGGAAVTMPGVTPPEIPFESYRKRQEQAKEAREQTEMQKELFLFREKEKSKRQIERSFSLPIGKRLEVAMDVLGDAKRNNWPIEDMTIRDPVSGANINFLTHLEGLQKQKTEGVANTKEGISYLKEEYKFHSLLMDSAKFLHGLKSDEGVTEDMSDLGKELLRGIGISGRALSPEEVKVYIRRFLPVINQKIETQHKILRKQKHVAKNPSITLPFMKQFKLPEVLNPERYAGEFETIKAYTDLIGKSDQEVLRDVEIKEAKLRESLSMPETRHVITVPEPLKGPTEGAINAFASRIVDERWIDGDTGQPYTRGKAKEVAEKLLKKK